MTIKCSCPKDSSLAKFLDGNLDQLKREKIIDHILNCSECLDSLLDFLEFLPDLLDEIRTKAKLNVRQKKDFAKAAIDLARAASVINNKVSTLSSNTPQDHNNEETPSRVSTSNLDHQNSNIINFESKRNKRIANNSARFSNLLGS